jgi:homoprotocatechuate degradation regulator HpaR
MADLDRDTSQSLPIALLRAREAVMARYRPMLAAHDLNEQQWRVIRVLAEQGCADATDLAARAAILAPSLTRILRALGDRGLITRATDAGDGRRAVLRLTTAGESLFATIAPQSADIAADVASALGGAEARDLIRLLNHVTRQLS